MYQDQFQQGKLRMKQTRFIIPNWKIGDRVVQHSTGLIGTVKDFLTQGHELVKVRFDGYSKLVVIHATDLVVHQVKP